jgi:hypothetical protein
LGVRHVRDGVYGNPAWGWFNDYFQSRVQQAARQGVRFDFIMGQPGWEGGSIDQLVGVLSGPLRGAVEAVEDPNEWDTTGGADFASALAAYDQQVYEAVKASPALRSVAVVGPSLVGGEAPGRLGDQQRWLDLGNVHPYMGGSPPSPSNTAWQLAQISRVSARKPVWATEVGYYDALGAPAPYQPVPAGVAAVYLLREFLEDFSSRIARTYAYELLDDKPDPAGSDPQQHFGLVRSDYTPKPAFFALRNLLGLVGRGSPSRLRPLALSVTGGPPDLRQLVLQQSDQRYLLVLWRTASLWKAATRQPIPITPAPVSVQVPDATAAAASDPLTTQPAGLPLPISGGQIHLAIGADPVIVALKTRSGAG